MSFSESGSVSDPVHIMEYKYKYAFTVKDNRKDSEQYEQFLKHLKKFGKVTELRVESRTKSNNPTKSHLHGTLSTNDKLYYKSTRVEGFHTHFKVISNAGWSQYINKQDEHFDWGVNQFSKKEL